MTCNLRHPMGLRRPVLYVGGQIFFAMTHPCYCTWVGKYVVLICAMTHALTLTRSRCGCTSHVTNEHVHESCHEWAWDGACLSALTCALCEGECTSHGTDNEKIWFMVQMSMGHGTNECTHICSVWGWVCVLRGSMCFKGEYVRVKHIPHDSFICDEHESWL